MGNQILHKTGLNVKECISANLDQITQTDFGTNQEERYECYTGSTVLKLLKWNTAAEVFQINHSKSTRIWSMLANGDIPLFDEDDID